MIKIDLDDFMNRAQCCGCGVCVNACPKNCIIMQEDSEGFRYPIVNEMDCVNCGLCKKVCPIIKGSLHENSCLGNERKPKAYAVMNKDEKIRLSSSSGGMFTILAEAVIESGGYVFGAAMSEDCKSVHHIGVNCVNQLSLLRGSKYLQSRIGQLIYKQVRELLEQGIKVLFSGTPCQIEGLKSFLGKEYDNLLCVDFICHGVPSPKVWKKYVDFRLRRTDGTSVRQTFFRHKNYGWKMFAVLFEYSNNTAYIGKLGEDLYLKAFLSDTVLRPSCHDCKFKKMNHESDITLADFWGIQNVLPEMDDDKGTSLVLLHSDKSRSIFEGLLSKMIAKEVNVDEAIKYNSAMLHSVKPNKNRKNFFENLEKMEVDELVEKYAKKKKTWKEILVIGLKKLGMYEIIRNIYKKIRNSK